MDKTAPASWVLAEVTLFRLCVLAHALPAVLNVSLTLFYLLFLSRTLIAHTSSGKSSLTPSLGQVISLSPH